MSNKVFYKINHFIQGTEFRVLDQFNKQVGVMSKEEALRTAREQGIDLVEIAPKALPPVVKLIDFAKFKYQQQQKEQEEKKKAKIADIKELHFTPVIAQGDFDSRMKKARGFLEGGDKVRLVVKFTGRMITKKEFGDRVMQRAVAQLEDVSAVEIHPRLLGKLMMMQLTPVKKKKIVEAPAKPTVAPGLKQLDVPPGTKPVVAQSPVPTATTPEPVKQGEPTKVQE